MSERILTEGDLNKEVYRLLDIILYSKYDSDELPALLAALRQAREALGALQYKKIQAREARRVAPKKSRRRGYGKI